MNRSELAKIIEKALLQDVNLSEEEYKNKRLESDEQTKQNGYEGKASVKEPVRARRMAMNFYGTVLNILVNMHATSLEILAEQKQTNRLLAEILGAEVVEETGEK